MFGFFRRRYRKDSSNSSAGELWRMKTGLFGSVRFIDSGGEGYAAGHDRDGLILRLRKKDLFAWMEDPGNSYRDFILQADVEIESAGGYSSVGFMLRKTGESEYYYFLVSSRGYFRFDAVLNGNPEEIIGWTAVPPGPASRYSLCLAVLGASFTFFINDTWAAEAGDDRIDAGGIAFCAQNYGDAFEASLRCSRLTIDSRPEGIDSFLNAPVPSRIPSVQARRALAGSFFAAGRYQDQVAQLQKIIADTGGHAADHFQAAQGYIRMGMYERALGALDKALLLDPSDTAARIERADMLYMTNRIEELSGYLPALLDDFPDHAFLLNLAGNAAFAARDWNGACGYYLRAFEADGSMPLSLFNAARSSEAGGRRQEAAEIYSRAAVEFFRAEDYPQSSGILEHLERIAPLSPDMRALKGKLLFQEGKLDEAFGIFEELLAGKYDDGSIFFLFGLILVSRGERREAGESFRKAVEAEPDYYLYHFRLAENSFILGEDCENELERALKLAPEEGWVLNLAGQVCLETGDVQAALGFLERAVKALPGETEVMINLSLALFRAGRTDDAFGIFSEGMDDPAVLNHLGNLYAGLGRYEEAALSYDRAFRRAPECLEYRENCAAAWIEQDMPLKAEEILSAILEEHPDARAYNLMGNCLVLTGEFGRARAAYDEAIRYRPDWVEPRLNLADLCITLGQFDRAAELLREFDYEGNGRYIKISERLARATTETVRCSVCGRSWTVPTERPSVGSLRLVGELPGELPAGRCPDCGKIYCIGCASKNLRDKRFVCPDCDVFLNINDDRLKYILQRSLDKAP